MLLTPFNNVAFRFSEEPSEAMVKSYRENGILQPIKVVRTKTGLQALDGRLVRAAFLAGMELLPVEINSLCAHTPCAAVGPDEEGWVCAEHLRSGATRIPKPRFIVPMAKISFVWLDPVPTELVENIRRFGHPDPINVVKLSASNYCAARGKDARLLKAMSEAGYTNVDVLELPVQTTTHWNTQHWVKCASDPKYVPIFPGDTRILNPCGEIEGKESGKCLPPPSKPCLAKDCKKLIKHSDFCKAHTLKQPLFDRDGDSLWISARGVLKMKDMGNGHLNNAIKQCEDNVKLRAKVVGQDHLRLGEMVDERYALLKEEARRRLKPCGGCQGSGIQQISDPDGNRVSFNDPCTSCSKGAAVAMEREAEQEFVAAEKRARSKVRRDVFLFIAASALAGYSLHVGYLFYGAMFEFLKAHIH